MCMFVFRLVQIEFCFRYATLVSAVMTNDCRYVACVNYYGDKGREGQ